MNISYGILIELQKPVSNSFFFLVKRDHSIFRGSVREFGDSGRYEVSGEDIENIKQILLLDIPIECVNYLDMDINNFRWLVNIVITGDMMNRIIHSGRYGLVYANDYELLNNMESKDWCSSFIRNFDKWFESETVDDDSYSSVDSY
jgi:hypothetical protein